MWLINPPISIVETIGHRLSLLLTSATPILSTAGGHLLFLSPAHPPINWPLRFAVSNELVGLGASKYGGPDYNLPSAARSLTSPLGLRPFAMLTSYVSPIHDTGTAIPVRRYVSLEDGIVVGESIGVSKY